MRLPKIGPPKIKGLFEEYFYAFLVVIFAAVAILGRAGGLSGYDALVIGAWVAVFIWVARQLKGYFSEKSKAANGKTAAAPQAPAKPPKGPLPPPLGMKPMIGPQWPLKSGPWPARPGLNAAPSAKTPIAQTPANPTSAPSKPAAPSNPKKRAFIYERPTLPDRKPKLPNNWRPQDGKKPKR